MLLVFQLRVYHNAGEDHLWPTFLSPPKSNHDENLFKDHNMDLWYSGVFVANFYGTLI